MLVSTNNFKNETDLRLQLYNSPANTNFIAFCYIIESNILSVANFNPSRFNTSHVNVYRRKWLCRKWKGHVSIHPMLMFIYICLNRVHLQIPVSIHPMLMFINHRCYETIYQASVSIHPMLMFIFSGFSLSYISSWFQYIPC